MASYTYSVIIQLLAMGYLIVYDFVVSYANLKKYNSLITSVCPVQVLGSIIGVMLIKRVCPKVGHGPRLNVGMHHGALTEGLLTFFIVLVSLGLKKKDPKSFFMKTWISSVCKGALHILGSDLTGGIMNPASVSAIYVIFKSIMLVNLRS